MKTSIEKLPLNSRVWVYTLSKKLTDLQVEELSGEMEKLLANWTRHGEALKANFEIIENAVLVIALDQDFNEPGGCSIDESIGYLKRFYLV